MNLLDMRTVVFSQLVTDVVCALVIAFLWVQNRKRFAGTSWWVVDFGFQAAATLLIILRGSIPDWMSTVLANTLVIAGALAGYIGLERFVGQTSRQVHNYVLLVVFGLVHAYFALVEPNLEARNLNVSLGLLIVCFQCAWLMLRRVPPGLRQMTYGVGIVFGAYSLLSLVRVVVTLAGPQPDNDFFESGAFEVLVLLSYQMLFILLTYSLALMLNRRLLMDIQTQEEKFAKAFRSSPYAITLTRLSDGRILEVNDGFMDITGYTYPEVVGKSTLELQLWAREQDRAAVVDELSKRQRVRGAEFQFRKKSGELMTGLFSAEIIMLADQPWVLSSISDTTERKRAFEQINSLAKFPQENPNPVLRFAREGTVLYASPSSRPLLALWGCEVGGPCPEEVCRLVSETFATGANREVEVACGQTIYSLIFAPVAGADYVNIYGRDITAHKQAEEGLRESEARLNRSQEIAHLGSWELDLVKNQLTWSDEVYRIFGLQPQEFGATYEAFLERIHPDDRAAVDAAYSGSLREGKSSYEIQHRVVRQATGEIRWVHEKCQHVRDTTGKIIRSVGMVLDITERVQAQEEIRQLNAELEQRVRERTAQLEAANHELEAFAYSVSHDLRAPLRAMDGFSRIVLEDYADRLDAEGIRLLSIVRNNAVKMDRLISDLLALSRVGRGELRFSRIDMAGLARAVYQEIAAPEVQQKFDFSVAPLPHAQGDPTLMRRVWDNLIANALKYTMPKDRRRIEIGGYAEKGSKVYYVKDSGVGFDPEYAHKLFGVFQRLHKEEEFEGTGVGLAIVQRIVHRHGGRTWAEGNIDQGATLYFSLPDEGSDDE